MAVLYLFDIDGTLLHAHGSGRSAFDAVMAAHHGVTDASAGISYGGKTDYAIIDEIFHARLGRPATRAEALAFVDAYLPRLQAQLDRQGVEVLGGVLESLAYLQDRAVLGVATGNVRRGAELKLTAAGLHPWFVLGGYGCDSHLRAELVARAIERGRAHRAIDEVIVVGDTVHDIAAARACNATVCAVATGGVSAEQLAHADVVFASMTELPAWHARRFG